MTQVKRNLSEDLSQEDSESPNKQQQMLENELMRVNSQLEISQKVSHKA